ncbi:MAG: hypothetical protein SGILL_006426 [Bacillariaceae sp.]
MTSITYEMETTPAVQGLGGPGQKGFRHGDNVVFPSVSVGGKEVCPTFTLKEEEYVQQIRLKHNGLPTSASIVTDDYLVVKPSGSVIEYGRWVRKKHGDAERQKVKSGTNDLQATILQMAADEMGQQRQALQETGAQNLQALQVGGDRNMQFIATLYAESNQNGGRGKKRHREKSTEGRLSEGSALSPKDVGEGKKKMRHGSDSSPRQRPCRQMPPSESNHGDRNSYTGFPERSRDDVVPRGMSPRTGQPFRGSHYVDGSVGRERGEMSPRDVPSSPHSAGSGQHPNAPYAMAYSPSYGKSSYHGGRHSTSPQTFSPGFCSPSYGESYLGGRHSTSPQPFSLRFSSNATRFAFRLPSYIDSNSKLGEIVASRPPHVQEELRTTITLTYDANNAADVLGRGTAHAETILKVLGAHGNTLEERMDWAYRMGTWNRAQYNRFLVFKDTRELELHDTVRRSLLDLEFGTYFDPVKTAECFAELQNLIKSLDLFNTFTIKDEPAGSTQKDQTIAGLEALVESLEAFQADAKAELNQKNIQIAALQAEKERMLQLQGSQDDDENDENDENALKSVALYPLDQESKKKYVHSKRRQKMLLKRSKGIALQENELDEPSRLSL